MLICWFLAVQFIRGPAYPPQSEENDEFPSDRRGRPAQDGRLGGGCFFFN